MSRPSPARRATPGRRARSNRRFLPSVWSLEERTLLSGNPPTGLTATAVSPTQINLTWTNQASNISATYVDQSTNDVNWTQIASLSGAPTSYTATGPFDGATTYYYEVWNLCSPGGATPDSSVASVTTPGYPDPPTLNSATPLSNTSIGLSWTAATGATGYLVERSSNNGSTWTTAGTTAAGVTTFTDTGLNEATSYSYEVLGTNAIGDSAPSAIVSAATQPAAPTGLFATAVSGSQVNLTWTDNSAAATDYFVQQSSNGTTWTTIVSLSGAPRSYTATGPFNGSTTYDFQVYAYAYTGGDSADDTASVTTPAFPNQPTITSATALSATSVALAWSSVTDATGYTIERSTNAGSTWTTAGTVATGVTTFTDTGLTPATTYAYEVIATNSAGSSAPSPTTSVATQPAAPTGLTATVVSGSQINLTWTDNSSAASYYYVQQSTNGTTWTTLASLYGVPRSYTATGPFNGSTTYDFQVYAYTYPGGDSADDTASAATPAFPNQPTLTSATAQSATSVALAWSSVTGATGYTIQRSTNAGSTWTTAGTVTTGATTFTDTGLTQATTYAYEVIATNSAGSSAPSSTMSVTTQPAAPTGLTATAISAGQVNLTWTDNASAADYYYIQQSTNGTTWTTIASLYGAPRSYTATGPFNGSTTYDFQVYAYTSPGGDSADDTTSVTMPAFPNQPTITSATAQSATSAALAWSSVPGTTGYTIERSTNGGSTWTTAGTVGAGVTTFTDTGLTQATTYSYEVIATNSAGSSAPSPTMSVATQPAAPTGLTATVISSSQINLTWTDNSPSASYYYVQQSTNGTTWTTIASLYGAPRSYTATGPFNGSTTYDFQVYAYAYTGGDSADDTVSVTIPGFPNQPTITSATAQSATSVALAWSSVTGATGYTIERSTNGGSTWTTAGTVGAGVTTFTDTGLTQATTYTYEVIATSSAGSSAASPTMSVTTQPAAPTGLTASVVSGSQVNLTWTDNAAAADYYYVQQSPNGTTWTTLASLYGVPRSYTASGPFNGSTTYHFQVYVYAYTAGDSADDTISVTMPAFPNQPTITSATAQSATSVALAWSSVTGATGYTIQRSTNAGSTWTTAGTVGTGVTTFTDTGLTQVTTYTYQVIATNSAGSSAASPAMSVATQPVAPTGLTASVVSGSQVNLTWTDNSSLASDYYVQQSSNGSTWTTIASLYGVPTSYTATGPFNGSTTYDFQVYAYASTGGDSADDTVSVTTPAFPNQPTLTSATALSATTVALAWSSVTGATGYTIQRSTNGGSTWTTAGTVGTGVTTFTDTGLTQATIYAYEVIATNAAGSSAPSPTTSVVTQPAAPTGLTATAVSGSQVNLTWTDNSPSANYYYVQQSPNGTTWTTIATLYGSTADSYTATGPFNGSTTYDFQVYAYSYTGGDSADDTVTVTTPAFPNRPTLTSAMAQSATSVALAWSSVTGATGYTIQRSTNAGSTWTTAGTVGAGVTTFTDTGLTQATTYTYQVIATNAAGSSAPSPTMSVSTQPAAPTGLTATAVAWNQVNLSWTDNAPSASYYYVQQSPNGTTWTTIASLPGSTVDSYTATGPFNGSTTYYFQVYAYAYIGANSADDTTSVTTPAFPNQPTLTSATALSATTVALAWSSVTGATGYTIERSTNAGSTWTTAGTVGTGVTTFTDTGLAQATTYTYEVIATNSAGSSAPSSTKSVTTQPAAPTGLTATVVSGSQINLKWTDNSSAASDYYVQQSTNGTAWTTLAAISGSTVDSYTATGPFIGSTTYYFQVYAYAYPGGDSADDTTSVTTPAFPNQPTLTSATALSATSVALAWSSVTGATGYTIERSTNAGSAWTTAGTVGTGVTTFTDTGLTQATTYTYEVIATNAAGSSAASSTMSVTTQPAAPTGLTATVVSGSQINLTWTDNATTASDYFVQQSSNGTTWTTIGSYSGSTVDSYTATGPFKGSTTYYFQVYAYAYPGGDSADDTVSVTTPGFPNQPTLTSATAQSATTVALAWSSVTGATGYTIQRSTNGGSTWTTAGTVGAGVTTFTDTGLTQATTYTYEVIATNSAGSSAPSATMSVATQPAAPTGLLATVVSSSDINLTWTDNSSAASYYYVQESTNGTTWTTIAVLTGSTVDSYTATGPFNGSTTYYFQVYAYAYTGGDSADDTTSVTTPAFGG